MRASQGRDKHIFGRDKVAKRSEQVQGNRAPKGRRGEGSTYQVWVALWLLYGDSVELDVQKSAKVRSGLS